MKHLLIALLVVGGCGKNEAPDSEPAPASAATAPAPAVNKAAFEARHVFQTVCATCHGPGGKGDGQAAASLVPKPRNYTDKAWQSTVTDEDIEHIILFGGQAVGKSPVMPGSPQLKGQPEVLHELVKIIRAFGA